MRQLLLVALALLMVAGVLGIIILFQPDDSRFRFYLDQADSYLEARRYRDVPELLLKASRLADEPGQWLSLLKRSYQAARETGEYGSFQTLVERSRKFSKANQKLDALYTASLLWTEQYERAAASLYALKQPGFETLIAESLLSFEVYRNYALEGRDPIAFIKEKIAYQEDPDFFRTIGTLAENEVLLYDAIVLYMEAGKTAQAEALLKQLSSARIPPFRKGVVYHDLGLFGRALEFYTAQDAVDEMNNNQRFAMKQQIGDLQFALGRKEEALESYRTALALHPRGSWKLYRNIARLLFETGYSRRARMILQDGLKEFPDQVGLLKDYVRFFAEDHDLLVRKTLEEFIDDVPGSMEARLLKIRYFPEPLTPTQYQAKLWEYFNSSRSNEAVSRFLLWYLSGLGDAPGIRIVLNRYRYEGQKPHWYIFYEGIALFLEKDMDAALAKMEEAYGVFPSWLYQRNLSMLNYSRGNLEDAVLQQLQAIGGLEQETTILNRGMILSEMQKSLGEMYLDRKDFESAEEAFQRALRLNPENYAAQSLLNRIR